MLHPRDPGGGGEGGREQRGGRGETRRPQSAAADAAAPLRQTPAKRRCCPRPAAAALPVRLRLRLRLLHCAAPPARHRTAAQRRPGGAGREGGEGGAMQSTSVSRPMGPRGRGGDMQSAAAGGQRGGALPLAAPPLPRLRGARSAAPHRAAEGRRGGGSGAAPRCSAAAAVPGPARSRGVASRVPPPRAGPPPSGPEGADFARCERKTR